MMELSDEGERLFAPERLINLDKSKLLEFKINRTYALYKRTILCINVNTLFQAFLITFDILAIAKILLKNRAKRLESYIWYFGFFVNA
ncbi:MAG: hypothetical protein SAK29_01460 [Scytonema sp. PMC 1069.18]|nr:hypothetical protein [Scytonema sp. PMC 1069.18]MEC4883801.1 hypothetical protein [Scytonema sp. PMC 1070.18]